MTGSTSRCFLNRRIGAARRGVFFRPVKHQLTLRLDADLIQWFKAGAPDGEGYQTRINRALREYINERDLVRKS